MAYEYRYASVRGLECHSVPSADPPHHNAMHGLNFGFEVKPVWKPVTGDHLLSLTWRELEAVSHVIRDAVTGK